MNHSIEGLCAIHAHALLSYDLRRSNSFILFPPIVCFRFLRSGASFYSVRVLLFGFLMLRTKWILSALNGNFTLHCARTYLNFKSYFIYSRTNASAVYRGCDFNVNVISAWKPRLRPDYKCKCSIETTREMRCALFRMLGLGRHTTVGSGSRTANAKIIIKTRTERKHAIPCNIFWFN